MGSGLSSLRINVMAPARTKAGRDRRRKAYLQPHEEAMATTTG